MTDNPRHIGEVAAGLVAEVKRLRKALKEERRAHRRSLNIPRDPEWDRLSEAHPAPAHGEQEGQQR